MTDRQPAPDVVLQIIFDFVGIENRGRNLSRQKYDPGLLSGRQESLVDILMEEFRILYQKSSC